MCFPEDKGNSLEGFQMLSEEALSFAFTDCSASTLQESRKQQKTRKHGDKSRVF